LTVAELHDLNTRLNSKFERGWYMGHTRRWAYRSHETASALRVIAQFAGWSLEPK
jgi:hypothetical protein